MASIATRNANRLTTTRGMTVMLWLPVAVLLAALLAAVAWSLPGVVEPPGLLLALNLVFLTVMPLVGAGLAIDAYRRTGVVAVLALGAGMVVMGLGAGLLPGMLFTAGGANGAITLHNLSMLLAAGCQVAAAAAAVRVVVVGSNRVRHIALGYGLAAGSVGLILVLHFAGLLPTFWSDGPTQLRQALVGSAVGLFGVSAFGWWHTWMRDPTIRFLAWYVPGLALVAIGLVATAAAPEIGGLLNWVGRGGQYLGAAYLFVAIATEAPFRSRRHDASARRLGMSLLQAGLPLRPLVESTSDAVIALAPQGRVLYWNDAARRLFGHDAADAFDRDVRELLVAPDGSPESATRLAELLDPPVEQDTSSRELRLVDRDGAPVPVEVHRFASTEDARIVVLVVRDISGRVSAQALLEERVQERTRALETANAELERANHAKDEFLGLVSHELKTPITTILAGANLLARHGMDEEGILADLIAETGRLAGLVDNLLVLARFEAGQAAEREPVLLDRIVQGAVRAMRRQHGDRDITVATDPGLVIDGNDGQLEMVVRNLVANAVKYGGRDGTISVEARRVDDWAVVSVADQGPGIAELDPSVLFEPFYRSTASTTVEGLGIGLTVCKRIVESMDGTIEARQRADRPGAEFRISLPMLPVDVDGQPPDAADTVAASA